MASARVQKDLRCAHSAREGSAGIALITFETSSEENNGMASALCDSIPSRVLVDVCRFNLASPAGLLADCLAGHKAAIIIDSSNIGTNNSNVSILDLRTMLDRAVPLNIGSYHGFSIADELRAAKRLNRLPERIIFFGFEVEEMDESKSATNSGTKVQPKSIKNASLLVGTIVETLKKDA
jgi:Ni,Fe-hydrogenase maturation factor